MKWGIKQKIILYSFLLIAITASTLIFFSNRSSYMDLENAIGERLEAIASTGALLINGDVHDKIQHPGDVNSDAYKSIRGILLKIKNKNNLQEDIYTCRREKNKLVFISMSNTKPTIGETVHMKEEMQTVLITGESRHTKIFKDETGNRISAYAPILNWQDQISGILVISMEVETAISELKKNTNKIIMISAIILLIGIFLGLILSQPYIKNLNILKENTEKISLGILENPIKISRKDEIGKIAQSMERIRISFLFLAFRSYRTPFLN